MSTPVAFNLEEYTPVSERIKAFWIDHPNGAIHSELVFDDGVRCVIKTTLWLDKNDAQATTVDYAQQLLSHLTCLVKNSCGFTRPN